MSDLREAAQQALEALEIPSGGQDLNDMALAVSRATVALRAALEALEYHVEQTRPIHKTSEAIDALRAALEQPEQEAFCDSHCTWRDHHPDCFRAEQPEWQSLTDDEIDGLTWHTNGVTLRTHLEYARALEAALKERNA